MQVKEAFRAMGARVKLGEVRTGDRTTTSGQWRADSPVVIDVRDDGGGEYFKLTRRSDVAVEVLDARADDRHVLLAADFPGSRGPAQARRRAYFLCGRDESHWFVAAIPEKANATDVQSAKDALKPEPVWEAMREFAVPPEHRDQRRTAAFIRQGEWFFIPRPRLKVNKVHILRDEPIRRGAGKPHSCQFLFRVDGQPVFVSDAHPDGLLPKEYWELPFEERINQEWREMVRDAHVYVKGNIRHPDHKTVWLSQWHEVVMNTESEAEAMRHVAFLD